MSFQTKLNSHVYVINIIYIVSPIVAQIGCHGDYSLRKVSMTTFDFFPYFPLPFLLISSSLGFNHPRVLPSIFFLFPYKPTLHLYKVHSNPGRLGSFSFQLILDRLTLLIRVLLYPFILLSCKFYTKD